MFDLRLLVFLSNLSAFSLFQFSILHFTIFWSSIGIFLDLNVVKASKVQIKLARHQVRNLGLGNANGYRLNIQSGNV